MPLCKQIQLATPWSRQQGPEVAAAADSLTAPYFWQFTTLPNSLGSSYTQKVEGIIKKAIVASW